MVILFLISGLLAQDGEKGHYFTITTWKVSVPEDGSRAEFNQMMQDWTDKITRKNDKVISEKIMTHASGHDSRDLVIITEYASWNDIESAQEKQNELLKAAWPEEKDRKELFKNFGRYFVMHSDEIYEELPSLRK